MKRDINAAVAAIVRGLHIGDVESMEEALHEALSELNQDMSDLFHANPEAAYAKVSSTDIDMDDEESESDSDGVDPMDDYDTYGD